MAQIKKMPGAALFVPANGNLKRVREALQHCEGCELYKYATQAVFGEGPENARVMLIGEQPRGSGRSRREAVRWSGGGSVESRFARGGDGPLTGVCDQCGEAFCV